MAVNGITRHHNISMVKVVKCNISKPYIQCSLSKIHKEWMYMLFIKAYLHCNCMHGIDIVFISIGHTYVLSRLSSSCSWTQISFPSQREVAVINFIY